jgi:hypothetical protein
VEDSPAAKKAKIASAEVVSVASPSVRSWIALSCLFTYPVNRVLFVGAESSGPSCACQRWCSCGACANDADQAGGSTSPGESYSVLPCRSSVGHALNLTPYVGVCLQAVTPNAAKVAASPTAAHAAPVFAAVLAALTSVRVLQISAIVPMEVVTPSNEPPTVAYPASTEPPTMAYPALQPEPVCARFLSSLLLWARCFSRICCAAFDETGYASCRA